MDKQTATQLIGNTFNFPFDEGRFRNFAINLLNNVDESKAVKFRGYIKHPFLPHIKSHRRLGTYTDPNGEKIDVLVVQLKNEWALERSRTMLRNFTSDYLKNRDEKDAALVAYYTTNPDDWRFSYIRMEYKRVQTDSGKFKIKEDITPAKRYSFLVGKNEPNHTAQAQLVGILSDDKKNPTLSELENAFSVDAVTEQFYKDYRTQFEKLWNELNDIVSKDPKIVEEFETKTIDTANFAKKLMGQIVFLYFLQKKGWLGVGKDENGNFKEWGKGPKNFLRRLFDKEFINYGNFFNDVLEPLFYEALATERTNDVFTRFNCKIPFLNGGLFEPINDYNWEETDIRIDNDLIGEVLKTFDQYNFTVREDEPLEKEVAVDPEMLGKVFENLLPENLRKGKGAYYTPRTIVHYMCQESLINYLDSECNSSILLEKGHKPAKKQKADRQDVCDTLYFDYESLTKQQKRNLPHWEQDNVAYFVTFRLWDSIPKEVAEKMKEERKEWKNRHKIETEKDLLELNIELKKEYYRLFSKRMDDLLDNGHGSCVLKNPEVSKIVENALNHFDGERYLLDHWVIMPNHVHVLVKPLGDWSLEKITHSWKSFTSNKINKILKREGQLWMHESFDHIVRSPEQLLRIRQYIKDNPNNLPSLNYRMKCNSSILVETGHKPTKKQRADKQDACDTIPKEDIETLIREGDIILELETAIVEQGKKYDSVLMDSIKENAQALDDALANIKVCDPAIGSGAFPVGMLTEIVKARKVLEIYLGQKHGVYELKRHCILNSLYGVDIDPGAIEIAKLRLWLSLVVDEDDYQQIQPLPNLDYKIMQGNSLIEEFHGISLDIEKKNEQQGLFSGGSDLDTLIDDLHQKQDDFFNAEHPREKKKKREAVETAIYNIFHNELEKKKSISSLEANEIETDLKEMTHGNKERNFFPWKLYFADVFREKGGFDVVIANPPYIGQKGNNKLFQEIKKTKFGAIFHQRRMDYFYFFFHKGLNITDENGTLTFITTNYYFTATYADKLRLDIFNRATFNQIINFNELKIFETALGQHNAISIINNNYDKNNPCKIVSTSKQGIANHKILDDILKGIDCNTEYYTKRNSDLFETEEKYIYTSKVSDKYLLKLKENTEQLGTLCSVIQGIVTGADKLSPKHISKYSLPFNAGEGIFVLSKNEEFALNLNENEKEILRPWFKNSHISKWITNENTSENLIYYSSKKRYKNIPNIKSHFRKYKPILINRNTRSGTEILTEDNYDLFVKGEKFVSYVMIASAFKRGEYQCVSYARDQHIFDGPKIVAPQRSNKNTFGYNEIPWYASADVYFITQVEKDVELKFILSLLNSKLYYSWLYHKGKRKGETLELYQKPLAEIPIKKISLEEQKPFVNLADQILTAKKSNPQADTSVLEKEIDVLVYDLYGLTEEEIAIVEESVV